MNVIGHQAIAISPCYRLYIFCPLLQEVSVIFFLSKEVFASVRMVVDMIVRLWLHRYFFNQPFRKFKTQPQPFGKFKTFQKVSYLRAASSAWYLSINALSLLTIEPYGSAPFCMV